MHQPVLYQEIISYLQPRQGSVFVDCTIGGGGHAFGILDTSAPDGRLLGLDVDLHALSLARQHLAVFGERVVLKRASYVTLEEQVSRLGWQAVSGVLIDLGVSSMQLDAPERGFSFRFDAPLDMRFDPDQTLTAGEIVNNFPECELADILYRFGEERRSRQVARSIVEGRPIQSTFQLVDAVFRVIPGGKDRIHPATRTFQALRMAVNNELLAIETVLPQAMRVLAPGGRLAVIAFHSLEDRLVKNFFKQESRDCICSQDTIVCMCHHHANLKLITRKAIRPSIKEIKENPRSRSAKLRVVEKLSENR